MQVLVLCLMADDTCPGKRVVRRRRSPALREAGMCRGEARASQVPGPSSSCVPWSNTPPDTCLSSPICQRGRHGLHVIQHPGHPGRVEVSGPHVPWPTRSRTYASPVPFLRPSPGSLPAWAGSPLAGRALHPLDDTQSFMKASPPPIPFDQPCLVALRIPILSYSSSNALAHPVDVAGPIPPPRHPYCQAQRRATCPR